jgi:hypothetical protein
MENNINSKEGERLEVLFWILMGIIIMAVLFGLKDWILLFIQSWFGNGKLFTVLFIVLFLLVISQSFFREYAPQYYDFSKITLMVYIIGLFIYRFAFKRGS